MGVVSPHKEATAERQLQYETGLESVLDLTEQLGFSSVFISDNTVSDVSALSARVRGSLDRIGTDAQYFFSENTLGAKNKGAGVLTQLARMLPAIRGVCDRVVFFEPRQRIEDAKVFQQILRADQDIFKVSSRLVLRKNIVPWVLREVHTGFFSISYNSLVHFVSLHKPEALTRNSVSIERALYIHLRRHRLKFEKARRLGLVRATDDGEFAI